MPEPDRALPADPTPWGHVLLTIGAGIVTAFQVGKVPPVLTLLQAELGLSLVSAGWVVSIFSATAIAAGSLAGAVADGTGYRRMILAGLLGGAFASLLGSLAEAGGLLLTTRFVEGLAGLVVVVSCPGMIVRISQARDRNIALGMWGGFMPAGMAASMLLAPLVVESSGWRALWRLIALLLAGYALAWGLFTRGVLFRAQAGRIRIGGLVQDILITLRAPGPVLVGLCFAMYAFQWLAVFAFLPFMLIREQGFGPGPASWLTALTVAINVVGNVSGGWLTRRGFQPWRLIAFAFLAMGLCSFGIYAGGVPFALRYALCMLFSMLGGILPGTAMVAAARYAPTPALVATSNGVVMQGAQLGSMTGPPLLAAVVSWNGWQGAPWLLASAGLCGLLLAVALSRVSQPGKIFREEI